MSDQSPDPPPKKARVFTEEAKQQQVSHWDMDYLPSDEVAKAMEEQAGSDDSDDDP